MQAPARQRCTYMFRKFVILLSLWGISLVFCVVAGACQCIVIVDDGMYDYISNHISSYVDNPEDGGQAIVIHGQTRNYEIACLHRTDDAADDVHVAFWRVIPFFPPYLVTISLLVLEISLQ